MRVLSGVKPSGRPHLGNYFGAIRQFIDFQQRYEGFYFIADLHALDQVRDAKQMRELSAGVALDFLALGLDPAKSALFRQSDIPEVAELQWILGTVTPLGLLQRAHAYKDAMAKGRNVEFGLFAYPVLMAADILLYDSDRVPVGKDQSQHIEITRDIAIKFNATYCAEFDPRTGKGGALKLPAGVILEETGVVPGTDGRKMSKSYGNTIPLFGTDAEWKKAVMGIVTDSTPLEAPKNPETCNVFALLKLFCAPDELAEIEKQYRAGGVGYGEFKKRLLGKLVEQFGPARRRREDLAKDPTYVHGVLEAGASRARAVAAGVMGRVKAACGLK
ncbi:MAG: tryptophan--tRNA ligase [Planctomycetes bacterium]|nr:tryptophan--tRNA ligase [Planctomycetota bacterium]